MAGLYGAYQQQEGMEIHKEAFTPTGRRIWVNTPYDKLKSLCFIFVMMRRGFVGFLIRLRNRRIINTHSRNAEACGGRAVHTSARSVLRKHPSERRICWWNMNSAKENGRSI